MDLSVVDKVRSLFKILGRVTKALAPLYTQGDADNTYGEFHTNR